MVSRRSWRRLAPVVRRSRNESPPHRPLTANRPRTRVENSARALASSRRSSRRPRQRGPSNSPFNVRTKNITSISSHRALQVHDVEPAVELVAQRLVATDQAEAVLFVEADG